MMIMMMTTSSTKRPRDQETKRGKKDRNTKHKKKRECTCSTFALDCLPLGAKSSDLRILVLVLLRRRVLFLLEDDIIAN